MAQSKPDQRETVVNDMPEGDDREGISINLKILNIHSSLLIVNLVKAI